MPKIHDGLTVIQSSMVWVVWDKRAKNVEKKPSDVRYVIFIITRILYLFQFKGRAFFQ